MVLFSLNSGNLNISSEYLRMAGEKKSREIPYKKRKERGKRKKVTQFTSPEVYYHWD